MTTDGPELPSALMDAAPPRSPLFDLLDGLRTSNSPAVPPPNTPFAMGEKMFLGKMALLGVGEQFRAVTASALGFELPYEPNRVSRRGELTALWLSPEEWLLVTSASNSAKMCAEVSQAVAGIHALAVDVSDRWDVICVTGSQAVDVLNQGTSLDLVAPGFPSGSCAQTQLGRVQVIIHQHEDRPTFDVFVDSTHAEFLWRWLENAATGLDPVVFFPDTE